MTTHTTISLANEIAFNISFVREVLGVKSTLDLMPVFFPDQV